MAVSITTTSNWVSNFVISMSFLSLTSFDLGEVAVWVILAIFSFLTWLMIYKYLPETKGYNLEEILNLFKKTESKESGMD